MRKLLLLSVFLFLFQTVYSQEMKTIDINGQKCVNGHIIVKFKRDPNNKIAEDVAVNRQMLIEKYKATVKKQWRIGAELWSIDTLQMPDATKNILDSLKRLDYIKYAEPDFIVYADIIPNAYILPNDPQYDSLWGLNQIHAPLAWSNSTGDSSMIVGIIDSGIDYNHQDLQTNIWTNTSEIPNNGLDDDNNGYIDDIHGWDFCNNDNDPMDDFGHGTHIAGIIGAVGNNSIGITGVNWSCKMASLKFLNSSGNGEISNMISALEYAITNNIKITNNSYGRECCECFSQAEYDAIQLASDSNIVFTASAGNKGHSNDFNFSFQHPSYPASYDIANIISVASNNLDDELSLFSNFGEISVDLSAPGESIYSTLPGNSYGIKSGTSMSTPYVVGAIANIWQLHPQLSNIEIKQHLLETVDIIPSYEEKISSLGRLNFYGASGGLSIHPFNLDFRAELVNHQSPVDTVFLTNSSDQVCIIDSIISGLVFQISKDTTFTVAINNTQISPKGTDTLYVRFIPDSTGYYSEPLTIYFRYDSLNNYQFSSELKGRGVNSGTIIQPGEVSGIWDSINSPYYINGDMEIKNNNALQIGPGVNVEFQGHYRLTVRDGQIVAKGNFNDTIKFYSKNTQNGWYGLRLLDSAKDDTLQFCLITNCFKRLDKVEPGVWSDYASDYCGGGLYARASVPFVSNCMFYQNQAFEGGGICILYAYNSDTSTTTITKCHILNNFAFNHHAGIYIELEGYNNGLLFTNNVVANNYATLNGGGLTLIATWNVDSILFICNNNFVNNKVSAFYGSAMYLLGQPILRNNIIWGNSDDGFSLSSIYGQNGVLIKNVKYNLMQEDYPGIGNICLNPSFINPTQGNGLTFDALHANWELKDSSKCINNGIIDTSNLLFDSTDILLNPRIYANVIDIGAYENQNDIRLLSSDPPDLLDFNAISLGDSLTKTIVLYSGTIPISIDSISIIQDSLNCYSIISSQITGLNSNSTSTIQIKYKPSHQKIDRGLISIYSNAVNNPLINVKLFGVGVVGEVINGGAVWGDWYNQNNNYNILGNIYIPSGLSLKIHSGVKVLFYGNYNLTVNQNAQLLVLGNLNDSVTFIPADTTSRWGGIKLYNSGSNDTLNFAIISYVSGVAVNIQNSNSSIINCRISNNIFCDNEKTGGIYLENSDALVRNNTISNNTGTDGGGINAYGCNNLIIQNNNIINNVAVGSGGGIYFLQSSIRICGNTILNNQALSLGGGGIMASVNWNKLVKSLIQNNVIVNNQCDRYGGGIGIIGSRIDLVSNIIINNQAGIGWNGGGVGLYATGNVLLRNNIITGNLYDQLFTNVDTSVFNIAFCNIQQDSLAGFPIQGIGNINTDPLFLNPSQGPGISYSGVNADWHLSSNSPCINAGTPDTTGINLPLVDLDGNVRIWFDTIDMGTYEYGAPPYIPPVPSYSLSGVFSYNNIANTAIDSVWVFRKQNGIKLDSVRSSISGTYTFQQVPNGSYTISAETDKPWGGINGTDALKIMRHFAGLEDLTIPVRKTSADVNNTQNINATDAVKVQLRCVGIDSTFERGDWTFEKHGGGDTVVIAGANRLVNFYGLCVGDVNGSNIPGSGAKSTENPELQVDNVIKAGSETELFLPVSVTSDCELGAVTLELAYPEDLIEIVGVSLSQINPYFTARAATFKAVWSDLNPVKAFADQPFAFIKVRTKEKFMTGSIVQFRIAGKMTELSDPRGEPISDVTISIPTIKYDEKPDHQYLYIYPNPAKSKTHVIYNARETGKIKLTMFDISMHRVREYDLQSANKGLNEFDLDVSNFATGEYLLELRFNGKTFKEKQVEKIIIGTRE